MCQIPTYAPNFGTQFPGGSSGTSVVVVWVSFGSLRTARQSTTAADSSKGGDVRIIKSAQLNHCDIPLVPRDRDSSLVLVTKPDSSLKTSRVSSIRRLDEE